MSLLKEFWGFMKVRKKFWLAHILIVPVILSGLIALPVTSPILSSILYPLF